MEPAYAVILEDVELAKIGRLVVIMGGLEYIILDAIECTHSITGADGPSPSLDRL